MRLNFFDKISKKKTRFSNLMKILPVGAELFVRDGRTDRQIAGYDEANNRFLQILERA